MKPFYYYDYGHGQKAYLKWYEGSPQPYVVEVNGKVLLRSDTWPNPNFIHMLMEKENQQQRPN